MTARQRHNDDCQEDAYFEHIAVPPDQSFLWRIDDYPWRRCLWNYHPEFELHLIRNSSGVFYMGDHIGHFEAGQLVLVGSNLPHNWVTPLLNEAKIPLRDIVVQFDPERIVGRGARFPEMSELGALFENASLGLEFFGATAADGAAILEEIGTLTGLARLGRLMELLSLLARSDERRSLATPEFVAQFRKGSLSEMRILEKALDFVQRHFIQSPSLAEVAALSNMSGSAFSRFFSTHTGNTFTDHVTRLKIWRARMLLSGSKLPVTDICYESGFNNISNFNRTFLAKTGLTPSNYRKAAKTRSLHDEVARSELEQPPSEVNRV